MNTIHVENNRGLIDFQLVLANKSDWPPRMSEPVSIMTTWLTFRHVAVLIYPA